VDVIKENMFFVVMGAVVLLALVLFVVVVRPYKSNNDTLQGEVQALDANLARLVGSNLPDQKAMTEAENYRHKYEEQFEILKDELSKMHLSTDLPGLDPAQKDEPGAFKTVYEKNVAALKRLLAEKSIAAVPETWSFWDWGEDVPKQKDQRELATKEYSLIRELIAIITSPELHVMQLGRVEVNPGETRTGDYSSGLVKKTRVEPYFDVFPFVVELWMPFERHELLIRELLRSKREIPIKIRKISMMRLPYDPRVYNRNIPPLYVGIRVEGWALDYKLQEKKPETTGPAGGMMRRAFGRGAAR